MDGPPTAGLDDLRRRLDHLQFEVRQISAYGRAMVAAIATLSPAAHAALTEALGRETLGLETDDGRQADLFAPGSEGLRLSQARLARDLERALVERAARLDGDGAYEEPQRRSG
ncbi:MAG: hypothetical protein Q7V15_08240 [Phenylobacterium sp.]|uniref:hypothetical protein n=1 Tax=Phenylobacterium sp. TaxID=1871053 RepID=UPI002723B3E0|nr:hypothetical protein [Phenylobacterium sp.]MDO8901327.1 hypothetical protein [Phenylobacterium sp.]